MQSEDMILASEFCIHHNIELSLIYSLHESGLVEITEIEEKAFVPANQLIHLEKLVRYMMKWTSISKALKQFLICCNALMICNNTFNCLPPG